MNIEDKDGDALFQTISVAVEKAQNGLFRARFGCLKSSLYREAESLINSKAIEQTIRVCIASVVEDATQGSKASTIVRANLVADVIKAVLDCRDTVNRPKEYVH